MLALLATPSPSPPSRLRAALSSWEAVDAYIAKIVREGLVPTWKKNPPPVIHRGDSETRCLPQAKQKMEEEIKTMVSNQIIVPVKSRAPSSRSVISRLFCVPKPDGRIRPIINL